MELDKISIYTDGACKGNPGIGSYGFICNINGTIIKKGKYYPKTTNNEMELMAFYEALNYVITECNIKKRIDIYTDSNYVFRGFTTWMHGWNEYGWKTKTNKSIAHEDLWKKIYTFSKCDNIMVFKVKGHSGNKGNDEVDELVNNIIKFKLELT